MNGRKKTGHALPCDKSMNVLRASTSSRSKSSCHSFIDNGFTFSEAQRVDKIRTYVYTLALTSSVLEVFRLLLSRHDRACHIDTLDSDQARPCLLY